MHSLKQKLAFSILLLLMILAPAAPATAATCARSADLQSCSTTYGVNEVFFGTGGQLCEPGVSGYSTNYCAKSSVGDLGVGNTKGTQYQAQAGFNTNREPFISLIINTASINAGTLSQGTTTTATANFDVKSYLAGGYSVVTASNPPTNGSYTMKPMTAGGASNSSAEQFGINLVANTTACGAPANFGAAPVQLPDSTFSFGTAAAGYNTCGQFKYNKGDVIAQSLESSGDTKYTISYIFNITPVTPGGTYTMNHVLVATSTF